MQHMLSARIEKAEDLIQATPAAAGADRAVQTGDRERAAGQAQRHKPHRQLMQLLTADKLDTDALYAIANQRAQDIQDLAKVIVPEMQRSTIVLTPAAAAGARAEGAGDAPEAPAGQGSAVRRVMIKALLIEDDRKLAALLVDSSSQHGVDAAKVADSTQALQHLGSSRFDILLIDLMLPGHGRADARAQDPRALEHARHHGHRPRRRRGQDRRARAGGGRLPGQARSIRASCWRASAPCCGGWSRRTGALPRGRAGHRLRRARGDGGRKRARRSPPTSTSCSARWPATPAACSPAISSSRR